MSDGYVIAGYGITVGALALYTFRILRRGRALSRAVPPTDAPPQPTGGEQP